MMEEIDFGLCLTVESHTQTAPSRCEKRKLSSVYDNITNVNNNGTMTTDTHRIDLDDNGGEEKMELEQSHPPRKRVKISGVQNWTEIQSVNTVCQRNEDGFENQIQIHSQCSCLRSAAVVERRQPTSTNDTTTGLSTASVGNLNSEMEMEIDGDTDVEEDADTVAELGPARDHYPRLPLASLPYGFYIGGRVGSLYSHRSNKSSVFTIYEDPEDMEIDGAYLHTSWFLSPEEDKENDEEDYEQPSNVHEMGQSSVRV